MQAAFARTPKHSTALIPTFVQVDASKLKYKSMQYCTADQQSMDGSKKEDLSMFVTRGHLSHQRATQAGHCAIYQQQYRISFLPPLFVCFVSLIGCFMMILFVWFSCNDSSVRFSYAVDLVALNSLEQFLKLHMILWIGASSKLICEHLDIL